MAKAHAGMCVARGQGVLRSLPSLRERTTPESWLAPGRNCWRVATSDRASVLVDADAYFGAVADAIANARTSVLILAWDIDSRTALAGGADDERTHRLGGMLRAALDRHPSLEVRVLNWDFALIYAFEREFLPQYRPEWRTHPRLRFHFDGTHPLGACHHQKVVVVDDAVAFAGGLDICDRRWDTSAHDPDDPRRIDLGGKSYPPFHDVQMVVDGDAARALGELARQRWRDATGETLPAPRPLHADHWPASVAPDFTDVDVAIARTAPASPTTPGVREVERLFLDAIAAARHTIYAENQYFTSDVVADALVTRLEEPDGPEVVIVVPRDGCGWLEEQTMSMRRRRIVAKLRAHDRFDRLRIYAPLIDDEVVVNVHSKVMIVDDVHLRVGSANLSNRSMAVDTECDLAIVADREATRAAIASVRDRLLADHLGVTPDEIAATFADTGSVIGTIERTRTRRHRLTPLPEASPAWLDYLPPETYVFDPVEPIDAARIIGSLLPLDTAAPRSWLPFALGAVGFLVGLALGRWTGRRATRGGARHD
jgi:phosphatidylserine/phosphatidylglycerophosphate/cardiolipin synthase-like enzyme